MMNNGTCNLLQNNSDQKACGQKNISHLLEVSVTHNFTLCHGFLGQ